MDYPYTKVFNLKNKINLSSIKFSGKSKIENHNANYKVILGFGKDFLAFIVPMFDIRDANRNMKVGISEVIIPGTGLSYNEILHEISYDLEIRSIDASIGALARGKNLALTMKIVPFAAEIIYDRKKLSSKIISNLTELDFSRFKANKKAWIRNDHRSKEAIDLLNRWNSSKSE